MIFQIENNNYRIEISLGESLEGIRIRSAEGLLQR